MTNLYDSCSIVQQVGQPTVFASQQYAKIPEYKLSLLFIFSPFVLLSVLHSLITNAHSLHFPQTRSCTCVSALLFPDRERVIAISHHSCVTPSLTHARTHPSQVRGDGCVRAGHVPTGLYRIEGGSVSIEDRSRIDCVCVW